MMRNQVFSAEIKSVKRLKNSVNGNPRWELFTDEGNYKTRQDSQCGYIVCQGWNNKDSILTTDGTGAVVGIDI
ncbi:hypothetical protein ACWF99_23685 [Nocardia sp. NPDC055002]